MKTNQNSDDEEKVNISILSAKAFTKDSKGGHSQLREIEESKIYGEMK